MVANRAIQRLHGPPAPRPQGEVSVVAAVGGETPVRNCRQSANSGGGRPMKRFYFGVVVCGIAGIFLFASHMRSAQADGRAAAATAAAPAGTGNPSVFTD